MAMQFKRRGRDDGSKYIITTPDGGRLSVCRAGLPWRRAVA